MEVISRTPLIRKKMIGAPLMIGDRREQGGRENGEKVH